MATAVLFAMVLAMLGRGASGHGAVTKPVPRSHSGHDYCPHCVGEHSLTNPSGQVHRDAVPSSPCMGTSRGDTPYRPEQYSQYRELVHSGGPFNAGQTFDATIVLDADHNGEARWSFCPHSHAETEECFRDRPLTEWIDVAAYWGVVDPVDHMHDGQHFPQTVLLPLDMPSGPATLRWLWVCKHTDELFISCTDVVVGEGDIGTPTTVAPEVTTTTVPPEVTTATVTTTTESPPEITTTTDAPEVTTTTASDWSLCGHDPDDCTHPWGLTTIFSTECLSPALGCNAMGLMCCRYCGFGVFEGIDCSINGTDSMSTAAPKRLI